MGERGTGEEKSRQRPEDEPTLCGVNRGVVESPSASLPKGDRGIDKRA